MSKGSVRALSGTTPDFVYKPHCCADCAIRHRAVCSYSTPAELALLEQTKFYRNYEPGAEIVTEGENTKVLGSVIDGVVALQKTLADGRRQIVGLVFPSDFIGRPLRPIAPYDAVAVTPVRMCLFDRSKFEAILAENANLERRLLEMMLDELDAAREWMLLLGRKTATEKLSSFLMILSRRASALNGMPVANGLEVPIPLTREAIAEFLGLTIETVSRQFSLLRKRKVVDLPSKRAVIILDATELQTLAGSGWEDVSTNAVA
ncbi:MAG: Crp/Fnr family transcriptional regulator [Pseudomonadota bacterium]